MSYYFLASSVATCKKPELLSLFGGSAKPDEVT
jgi:hypothetical protein